MSGDWRLEPYDSQLNPRRGSPITWVLVIGVLILGGFFIWSAIHPADDSDSTASDETSISRTVDGFYSALHTGDAPGACARLDENAILDLVVFTKTNRTGEGSGCNPAMRRYLSVDPPVPGGVGTAAIAVDDSTATLEIPKAGVKFELIKLDDRWLIDSGFLPGPGVGGVGPDSPTAAR